ncbi:MAG TPA: hypothetical protein VFY95_09220 [Sphingomicrobium sp.]
MRHHPQRNDVGRALEQSLPENDLRGFEVASGQGGRRPLEKRVCTPNDRA